MRSRYFFGAGLAALLFAGGVAQAGPVEMPPAVVDGKMVPYYRVKKFGRIWYPASVVGHFRRIDFSYDYATGKLYANGVETMIETVVVDDVVYLNMTPEVTQGDMRPGMDSLAARRQQLESLDRVSPHFEGRTDALFMSQNVPHHAHPWTGGGGDRSAPIIDLDPTNEAALAPHMRPGARPLSPPPRALPSRLPRPGEVPPSEGVVETVKIPPAETTIGIPTQVTSQGGPALAASPVDPTGLQPIPVTPAAPAPDTSGFNSSGRLGASSAQNSVFKVDVTGGEWHNSDDDNLLRLKLHQTNLSRVAQSNLGTFTVRCEDGSRVEASRTRSSLPDGVLAPGSYREGELVFRLTDGRKPRTLELEGALSLSVSLRRVP